MLDVLQEYDKDQRFDWIEKSIRYISERSMPREISAKMQASIAKIKDEVAKISSSSTVRRSSSIKRVDITTDQPNVIYSSNPMTPTNEAVVADQSLDSGVKGGFNNNPFLQVPDLALKRGFSVEIAGVPPPLQLNRVFSKDATINPGTQKYLEVLQKPAPQNLRSYIDPSPVRVLNGPWHSAFDNKPAELQQQITARTDRSTGKKEPQDMLASSFQPVTLMMEMHDVYIFLHRAMIRSHLQTFPDQKLAYSVADLSLRQVRKEFEVLSDEMSAESGYYSDWLEMSLSSLLSQFERETLPSPTQPDPMKILSGAIKRMFTSIKLLAAAISKSVFEVLRIKGVLDGSHLAGVSAESRYLIPVFDQIFNKRTYDRNTLKRSMVSKEISGKRFPLKDVYTKALISDNEKIIQLFASRRAAFDPELEPFFRLDATSVELVRNVAKGELELEFLVSVQDTSNFPTTFGQSKPKADTSKLAYAKTIKRIEEIFHNASPFDKAVTILNAAKCVEIDIADFYSSHNLELSFTLTQDELFPILLWILKHVSSPYILVDLQLVKSFLPEDLRLSLVGYYTESLLIAYHNLAGDAS